MIPIVARPGGPESGRTASAATTENYVQTRVSIILTSTDTGAQREASIPKASPARLFRRVPHGMQLVPRHRVSGSTPKISPSEQHPLTRPPGCWDSDDAPRQPVCSRGSCRTNALPEPSDQQPLPVRNSAPTPKPKITPQSTSPRFGSCRLPTASGARRTTKVNPAARSALWRNTHRRPSR